MGDVLCYRKQLGTGRRHLVGEVISWWLFVLRYEIREIWRALPGPWWVKVPLMILAVAEPGPFGEMAILGIAAMFRALKARREVKQ